MKFLLKTAFIAMIAMFFIVLFMMVKNGDSRKPDSENKIDAIFADWNKPGSPGCAVLVYKDGKTVFEKGYGLANIEYSAPITPDTLFHIASVSKQFTAYSILLLENEGRLSLNDDIRKYLPYMPDFGFKITIRNLLNHTSGLRDQWALAILSGMSEEDVITQELIIRLATLQKDLNFKPGNEYMYSNTGYTLLAEIVRTVSGESFCDYTRHHIFDPLGMNYTFFHLDQDQVIKNRAYSYNKNEKGEFKNSILSYANVGATSLYTSINDLAKWMDNFFSLKVGNKKVMDKFITPGTLNNGRKISYACGIVVDDYRGWTRYSHSGGDAGFRTYLAVFPEEKIGIAILSNLGDMYPEALSMKIADMYLSDKSGNIETQKESSSVKVPVDILNRYAGNYESDETGLIVISSDNGALLLDMSHNIFTMNPLSNDRFFVKETSSTLSFKSDSAGKVTKFVINEGGESQIDVKRIDPANLSENELKRYEGKFYSDELETVYDVIIRNGRLYLYNIHLGECPMIQGNNDVFYATEESFSAKIQFVRGDKEAITGFRVSAFRARNILFRKLDLKF